MPGTAIDSRSVAPPPLHQLLRTAVGLLALGGATLWVLQVGASLDAPRRLSETWRISDTCVPNADLLHVSQSGVFLEVTWPGGPVEHLQGRLDGERVRLRGMAVACDGAEAKGGGTWTLDQLRAKVEIPGCAPCPSAVLDAGPVHP